MNKFVLWLNLLSLFIAHSASAYDCTPQVEHYLPELNLQAPILEVANNSHFCFDESAIKDSVAISKFNYLKNKGVFVDNCLIEKNMMLKQASSLQISFCKQRNQVLKFIH